MPDPAVKPENQKFHKSFWTANLTELFERSAYYAVASFVVIYLGQLGLGDYWPSTLSSSVLWGLVYFLPILSGTIADQVGFKKALLVAFVLLAIGYFMVGAPVWFGFGEISKTIGSDITASVGTIIAVVFGIVVIGCGGSIIKPCISGTVQKTAGQKTTLAFAIFYMVINIGSLVGRFISYLFRTQFDLSYIWGVASSFSVISFFLVLFLYQDVGAAGITEKKPSKSIGSILTDMFLVLKNLRFALFLIVSTGFFFLYSQVYNVLPLYWKRVLETDPAVDLYTAMNPFVIVFFQLLITHLFGKMKPISSMVVGTMIVGLSWLINVGPILFSEGGIREGVDLWVAVIPIGAVIGIATVGLIAFGELFTSARLYEYIGSLAPKGREGLFLGYANLPIALGAIIGGPVGASIFNEIMCKGSTVLPNGLLELDPEQNTKGWIILMSIGLGSAVLMWAYNIWLKRQVAKDEAMAEN
jgi:dipeptide/tripeptide permease